MAKTKISDLGGREIIISGKPHKLIPALGNGVAKPGDSVGITDATGKVVGTDIGASEMFRGFLDNDYKTDEDTAIPDGSPCCIIVPISGESYRLNCTDPTGAVVSGLPHIMSTTAGKITGAANTNLNTAGNLVVNNLPLANGDTVMEATYL